MPTGTLRMSHPHLVTLGLTVLYACLQMIYSSTFFAMCSNCNAQRSPGADQLTPQANTHENSLAHPSVCPRTQHMSFTPFFTISPPQAAIKLLTALGRWDLPLTVTCRAGHMECVSSHEALIRQRKSTLPLVQPYLDLPHCFILWYFPFKCI